MIHEAIAAVRRNRSEKPARAYRSAAGPETYRPYVGASEHGRTGFAAKGSVKWAVFMDNPG
jgi:hypothetical protein